MDRHSGTHLASQYKDHEFKANLKYTVGVYLYEACILLV